jgi:hypothetical protein
VHALLRSNPESAVQHVAMPEALSFFGPRWRLFQPQ